MNYLLETNILLLYLRENKGCASTIDVQFAPLAAPNVSVVSIGEIRSIAIQGNWGQNRLNKLFTFLGKFPIADIHVETIIQRYAEIDAFSQGLLHSKPSGVTARNMGKK